jgi:uncharacterized protein HemX
MQRLSIKDFPRPKSNWTLGQKLAIIILSAGLFALAWYIWNQSNKKHENTLAQKQKELDDIKQDQAMTEDVMKQIGAEHILRMAERVVQSQKPKNENL